MKVFFTTEEERMLLKKLIGKKLNCIKIDSDSEYWTRAVLFADDFAIEIHVDMEDFDFCGFTEELRYVRVAAFGDAGSVHRPRFQSIRQVFRHLLPDGFAAGSAVQQR